MLSSFSPITTRTQDHDGKPVPLVRFNFSYLPLPAGPLPADVQFAMRTALTREVYTLRTFMSLGFWLRGICFGAAAPLAMLGLWLLVRQTTLPATLGPLVFVVPLIVLPGTIVIMYIFAPLALTQRMRTIIAATAVQHGYCGSCGYPLPAPRNDQRALTTCTECGAAWNGSPSPP